MSNINTGPFTLSLDDLYKPLNGKRYNGGGLNNLPSFLSHIENDKDSELKYIQDLEGSKLGEIFDKPRLDREWIDEFKKKVKWQEDFDFDTFVTSITGSTTNKELRMLDMKFPDIIKKKELPPLSNIELHQKIAKLIVRGLKTEEDYVLTYLICGGKLKYNQELLLTILKGFGYTSQDKDKKEKVGILGIPGEMELDLGTNGKIRTKDYKKPPSRVPTLINPFHIHEFDKSRYFEKWGSNTDRFDRSNDVKNKNNHFGQPNKTDVTKNRYSNNYFLNLK